MEFGHRLKELRQQKGLTQADLANLLELGATAISNYEANRNEPAYDKLIQLADYFDVSCDYLLGKSDNFLPVRGEVIDRDMIEIFNLYQQMDLASINELKHYSRYLVYRQNEDKSTND